jgi:hypothetical protein
MNDYEADFYPKFVDDDNFEVEREALRSRLLAETRAEENRRAPAKLRSIEDRMKAWGSVEPEFKPKEGAPMSRWKYAFRDLKKRVPGELPRPTVIVTRKGK